jgi:nitrite reductase/ring-hydroxylating ferredoxin subunit
MDLPEVSAGPETKRLVPVAPVGDFREGFPILVTVGRFEIGVYRIGEIFQAILNFCPHEGIKICKGKVGGTFAAKNVGEFCSEREGEILTCPWHGWQFDLLSGQSLHDARCRLKTFPTEVVDGVVHLRMP